MKYIIAALVALSLISCAGHKPKSAAVIYYEADACKKTGNDPFYIYDKYGRLHDVVCRAPAPKKPSAPKTK